MPVLRVGFLLPLAALLASCARPVAPEPPSLPPEVVPEPPAVVEARESDSSWLKAEEQVCLSVDDLLTRHPERTRRSVLWHGNRARPEIALTFDDGPHPDSTPQLLTALAQAGVPATFFVVGKQAEAHPELIRAALAAGHCVGNHTYHHVNLTKVPPDRIATELKACGDAIEAVAGQPPHLFRPPGGEWDSTVAETAETLGYTTVLWTDDPGDYTSPGGYRILDRTLRHAGHGGIVLLHDGPTETLQVLPQMIADLKARGLKFVTVDELLAHRAVNGTSRE